MSQLAISKILGQVASKRYARILANTPDLHSGDDSPHPSDGASHPSTPSRALANRLSLQLTSTDAATAGGFALFPGSFNPLHDGHRRIQQLAAEWLGVPVEFELAIENVEKAKVDDQQLLQRLASFGRGDAVWVTNTATFAAKHETMKPSWFVVGIDTIVRIGQSRFYRDDPSVFERTLDYWLETGLQFLVFGRRSAGTHLGLAEVSIDPRLRSICREVEQRQFSMEISSSSIRAASVDSQQPLADKPGDQG